MKAKSAVSSDDMRAEYGFDYSKAVRGKYYRRLLKEGANVRDSARSTGMVGSTHGQIGARAV
jgi:hypothetical protein